MTQSYWEKLTGMFITCIPDKKTKNDLDDFCKRIGVPNYIGKEKLHCTLIHSSSNVYHNSNKHCDVVAKSNGLEVWKLPDKGMGIRYALVLKIDSPEIQQRYSNLLLNGAICQYGSFSGHITLSMNVPEGFIKSGIRFENDVRFIREEFYECRGELSPL